MAFNRLNKGPSQRLRREVGFWWCLSHENIIPLLGLAKDEEFGSFGAIISPVCNLVGNNLILNNLSGIKTVPPMTISRREAA